MLFRLLKAEGHSMEPVIKNGSFFIASNIVYKFSDPKINDKIIFKFKNKFIVKKIKRINNKKYFIEGVNKKDSRVFPSIERKEILGKVLWIL